MVREEVLELLRTDSVFREEVRRQILTEELLALPPKVEHLAELVAESLAVLHEVVTVVRALVEAQQRTEATLQRHEEQIGRLIQAQQRHGELIERLIETQQRQGEQIERLIQAQQRTEEELRKLVNWQQGERGRREGEDYERNIIRRAPFLFQGGLGGSTHEFEVRRRLTEQLESILAEGPVEAMADPFLADVLWWKGEQVAVVEVSQQVNGYDVVRASERAETLRRAGLQAIPIVMGEEWTGSESSLEARSRKVQWKVGSDLSEGFLSFRRAPSK
jgi:hypothetical protein